MTEQELATLKPLQDQIAKMKFFSVKVPLVEGVNPTIILSWFVRDFFSEICGRYMPNSRSRVEAHKIMIGMVTDAFKTSSVNREEYLGLLEEIENINSAVIPKPDILG